MTKLKSFIIVIIIYLVFYLSYILDLNILYPYYLIKDLITYPVHALTDDKTLELSDDMKNGIYTQLKEDINELKKLNDIKTVLSDFSYLNATIISHNREYWFNTITIDKGKKDGIKLDMAVIDGNGLIGRVVSVRDYTSDIKLITCNDSNFHISVVMKSDNENVYGITTGYNIKDDYLEITLLSSDFVKEDSMIYTTGMGGVFPSGILIGKVITCTKDTDEVKIVVKATLASNLKGDKYVSVLQRKEDIDS